MVLDGTAVGQPTAAVAGATAASKEKGKSDADDGTRATVATDGAGQMTGLGTQRAPPSTSLRQSLDGGFLGGEVLFQISKNGFAREKVIMMWWRKRNHGDSQERRTSTFGQRRRVDSKPPFLFFSFILVLYLRKILAPALWSIVFLFSAGALV